jgi:hypothetical protein
LLPANAIVSPPAMVPCASSMPPTSTVTTPVPSRLPTVSVLGSSVMLPSFTSTPLSVSVALASVSVPELVRVAPEASELFPVSVQDAPASIVVCAKLT